MDLFLFYKDLESTKRCISKQITGIIIDWERKNKFIRQANYNTQINHHNLDDLIAIRNSTKLPILVRVNGFPDYDENEVKLAIQYGADEIILPMVKNHEQIEQVLKSMNGQCKLGILIETNEGIRNINEIASFELSRIYIGLNDLSIDRSSQNIFMPFLDGTLESLKEKIKIPFGYGGLTHINHGHPIPCHLLLTHMVQTGVSFTFLRRSFYKSLNTYSQEEIFESIKNEIQLIQALSPDCLEKRIEELEAYINSFEACDT